MEKQQKKLANRKNTKSISSLIRKFFGRKSREANANNPSKEESEAVVNGDLSRSADGLEGLSPVNTDQEISTTEIARNDSGRDDSSEEKSGQSDKEGSGLLISKDSGIASIEEMAVSDGVATATKTKVSTETCYVCNTV